MGLMDKSLPLSLEVLGAAFLIFPCFVGNLSRTGGCDGHAGWVGALVLSLPVRVSGRQAPVTCLVPDHQLRGVCFT